MNRPTEPIRQTWAEVNLDAITHNIKQFREYLPSTKQIIAVVKANAYGHGAYPVAKVALESGATMLAVALLEEAIELRREGIKAPILVLGPITREQVHDAQQYQVSISIHDLEAFQETIRTADQKLPPLHFHIKVDTGMSRLGFLHHEDLQQLVNLYKDIQKKNHVSYINWEGVYTHLATADEEDESYALHQLERFESVLHFLQEKDIRPRWVHMANSAATIRFPHFRYTNLYRVGISMYGLHPSNWLKQRFPFQLQQAFSLYTRLSLVKRVPSQTGVSYGLTYVTEKEEWLGTIPIGYADGWNRHLSNKANVLVGGEHHPLVGRVCMDSSVIQLNEAYERNELVTLIGKQGSNEITVDHVAAWLETINYEIPCMISARVPRFYIKQGHYCNNGSRRVRIT